MDLKKHFISGYYKSLKWFFSPSIFALIVGTIGLGGVLAEYNQLSSLNMVVMQAGLIPAQQAHLRCISSIERVGEYYGDALDSSINLERLLATSNFPVWKERLILDDEGVIADNYRKAKQLERFGSSCDQIYSILYFPALALGDGDPFNAILKKRKSMNLNLTKQVNFLDYNFSVYAKQSEGKVSAAMQDNPNYTYIGFQILGGKSMSSKEDINYFTSMRDLQVERLREENKYFALTNKLLSKSFEKRVHRNAFRFIWSMVS